MRMLTRMGRSLLLGGALLMAGAPLMAQQALDVDKIDIPYKKFVLPNGLTLLVHEDHQTPIVGVNLWYHVGSKNERRGKTGFAHLFEHLMFNGSEHYPYSFREAMDNLGANNRNGTTNTDRTNFFQTVPTSGLERTLYLEADRMGWLLARVNEQVLEQERGVVKNEKRQGENQPYALAFDRMVKAMYPYHHPYSWTTIGEMEDLNAASLADVREWFQTYYGPANCVLSLAGDITPEKAYEMVMKYFGAIPSGPPLTRFTQWIPTLDTDIREQMYDRVPQARITKAYHIPGWGTRELALLNLAASALSGSKTSRLDRRLVYEKQLCTAVSVGTWEREIASTFIISATAKPGVNLADVEREMDAVVAEFLTQGPTEEELATARTQIFAEFLRGMETLGGFGGRSDVLAESQTYGGTPDAYKSILKMYASATAAEVKATANSWLTRRSYTIEILPFPAYKTGADVADRTQVPALGDAPALTFPAVQKGQLKNGLKVQLTERKGAPIVLLSLMVDAGYAADPQAAPGTVAFTLDMLDEGTATRTAFQITEQAERLGAQLGTGNSLDQSFVRLNALKANLAPSLELMADLVLNPAFRSEDLELARKRRLAGIAQEKAQPNGAALRAMPRLLYGADHPYGRPFTGSGTEAAVQAMKREDLVKWHQTWFTPGNATLVVSGDISLAELMPLLEKYMGSWKGGKAPAKAVTKAPATAKPGIYLIDKPGAVQSYIVAGILTPSSNQPEDVAMETVMRQFGGMATARLNLNLRMDKHWSYGYNAQWMMARGMRPLMSLGGVQTDKTKESMVEILREWRNIAGEKPIQGEEFANILRGQTLRLPGSYETITALNGAVGNMVAYGYPEAYYANYAANVQKLTEANLAAAAKKNIDPSRIVWVVVGDRAKIEAGLRELNYGAVVILDADGNEVK